MGGQFGSLTDLVVNEMISEFQAQLESLFPRLGTHMHIAVGGFAELRKDGLDSIPEQVLCMSVSGGSFDFRVDAQAHVRVVASDAPYPTVANMVQVAGAVKRSRDRLLGKSTARRRWRNDGILVKTWR